MDIRIISGTPGINREQVVEKIRLEIEKTKRSRGNGSPKVRVSFVEEELVGAVPRKDYCNNTALDQLNCIITQVPQDRIRNHWRTAFENALAHATSGDPDLAIVVACLSYYRKETYEFYSPVDIRFLIEKVKECESDSVGILTLIDDVFDLYYRLSDEGHVFSNPHNNIGDLEEPSGSQTARYKQVMKEVLCNLIRILEWRDNEIQAAAGLGSAIGIRPVTLAVKHPIETGVRLLLGNASVKFGLGHSLPVYLSHPISVPRRENRKSGLWQDVVSEFMDFVDQVRKDSHKNTHVVPIMPTAIDEFRFLKDGNRILPWLSARWPLPDGDLMYSAIPADKSYEDHEKMMLCRIFDPPVSDSGRVTLPPGDALISGMIKADSELSGMLMTLESLIQLQMANRDHMLVRQCPGFLMYRPLHHSDPRFTGGVRAEIHDQNQLRDFEDAAQTFGRPIAAIHSKCDLETCFAPQGKFTKHVVRGVMEAAEKLHQRRSRTLQGQLSEESASIVIANPTVRINVTKIYEELFCGESGSIATVDPIPMDTAQGPLQESILYERAKCLCGGKVKPDLAGQYWPWCYAYLPSPSTQSGIEIYPPESDADPPIVLVIVADDLENDTKARAATAKFVVRNLCDRMLHLLRTKR